MNLAVLFWFYKDPAICENRLRLLRRFNPEVRIYGLFGGTPADAPSFRERLGAFLDDFFVFDLERDDSWKWLHGDQLIVRWFSERGRHLGWDTIFVAQWDMLVFDDVRRQFVGLRRDEMLFSGVRPVAEVEPWWWYVRPGSAEREEFLRFMAFVRREHGFSAEPLCGEFIVVCLPRAFLEPYSRIPCPELGFLEYKIPVYAQIFGTALHVDHRFDPWWGDYPATRDAPLFARALNSERQEVPLRTVTTHLLRPSGRRIFHPVYREYPLRVGRRARAIAREVLDHELKPRWWRLRSLAGMP